MGKWYRAQKKKMVYIVNKPRGIVCTTDQGERKII